MNGILADDSQAMIKGGLCDVRDFAAAKTMMENARRDLGGIDGLVNSAGMAFIREFSEVEPEEWREIVDTNLTGVYNCCSAALPHLKIAAGERGVADIVNVGSRSGRYSFAGGTGYNATKFGLQGLTEAMFLDLSRFGVRVGLVAPGTVATGFGGTAAAEWHLQPEDVADAVASMIGARAGACINWIEMRPARPPT